MFTTHSERPTTTISNSIPADTVLVAIDIAKVRNEVLLEAPGHRRRRRLSVVNSRAEHDSLIEVLGAYTHMKLPPERATAGYADVHYCDRS